VSRNRAQPNKQRAHRPHELGPRLFRRGRWWAADLRPWRDGHRPTLRDPDAAGWPTRGERTDHREVALRWALAYVDHLRGLTRRRHLKLRPDAKPLDVAIAEYLAHRERTVEPFTVRNDRATLTVHLLDIPDAANLTTEEVTTEALQALFDRLAANYRRTTLHRYRANLAAFFGWAGQTGDANPARGVVLRELADVDARAWDDTELTELRRAADGLDDGSIVLEKPRRGGRRGHTAPDSYRLCLELALGVGARSAELFALEWPRFRFADHTVRINAQVDERGTGLKPLKGKANRTTLVLPSFGEYLARRVVPVRGRVLTPRPGLDVPLWHGQHWAEDIYRAAGLYAHRLGWHTLRHTYARLFLELGGSLEQLQRSLGHQSIRTTEQDYEHFTHDAAADAARRRIYGQPATGTAAKRA
jgi:integrase